jgi:5-oxoprolinase (ATP-hydrolysing) subunit A
MPARRIHSLPIGRMKLDLNCDLGENEPRSVTSRLLRHVTSVNIACGGHAGDVQTMKFAVKHAVENDVLIGAHPGFPDRENFGRQIQSISPAAFKTLLLQQISALEKIVHEAGSELHHVKLHGALYHMVEGQRELRKAYFEMLKEFWPGVIIYSIAGGRVAKAGSKAGIDIWGEAFLDRGYMGGTRLIPRGQPGSVLNGEQFEARLRSLNQFPARTWCIHSDSPNALQFAKKARRVFESV